MKKTVILFFLVSVSFLYAGTDFYGTASIAANFNIPVSGSYSSLLNPDNFLGIKDMTVTNSLVGKLDSFDEDYTFSAWFSMKEYPAGPALLAASYGNAEQTSAVGDIISAAGDSVYTFDLLRFSINLYITDNLAVEAGRQSMLTGYGYGWNPIDFADPLKNPMNPDEDFKGVDAVSFKADAGNNLSLIIYALTPSAMLTEGLDYREILPGCEVTLNMPGAEFKLAGIWDYDETDGDDAYTSAAGAAFNIDILGTAFYGESAVRWGSRNYFPGISGLTRKTELIYSWLAGFEYTFSFDMSIIAEYFYNGEGYDSEERLEFESMVKSVPVISSDILNMYTPGYFSRQYILLNLMQSFYEISGSAGLSVLYSPDSGSMIIAPGVSMDLAGSITLEAVYTGLFSLKDDEFNGVEEIPSRQMISITGTYSF